MPTGKVVKIDDATVTVNVQGANRTMPSNQYKVRVGDTVSFESAAVGVTSVSPATRENDRRSKGNWNQGGRPYSVASTNPAPPHRDLQVPAAQLPDKANVLLASSVAGVQRAAVRTAATQPYNFVSVDISNAVTDAAQFHHGVGSRALKSGVLKVSWTTLTPTLIGHEQDEAKNFDPNAFAERLNAIKNSAKKVLTPLRADWLDRAPVLWQGSSVKGAIRGGLSRLLAAPMERVAERHYTYRPNLDQQARGGRLKRMIGVVTTVEDFGGFNLPKTIKLIEPHLVFYVNCECIAIELRRRIAGGGGNEVAIYCHDHHGRKMLRQNQRGGCTLWVEPQNPHSLHRYHHGADGFAKYASAFNTANSKTSPDVHTAILVPSASLEDAEVTVPEAVRHQFAKTIKVMRDEKIGHHVNHPLSGIPVGNQSFFSDYEVGDALVLEVSPTQRDAIITLGHYFNYRTAYATSVRQKLVIDTTTALSETRVSFKLVDRPEVRQLDVENVDGGGGILSGARGVFGYVNIDAEHNGTVRLGDGAFERLAGRIGFNHPIEIVLPEKTTDADRFVNGSAHKCWVAFKQQGSPKSSAVENYLLQRANAQLPVLKTYGDSYQVDAADSLDIENESDGLRGRKIYLHQAEVNDFQNHFDCLVGDDTAGINDPNAMLGRFVSKSGITFKSAIHYQDLRDWELGALMASVCPGEFALWVRLNLEKDDLGSALAGSFPTAREQLSAVTKPDDFALKLGFGRPLGLGSVVATIDEADTTAIDAAFASLWTKLSLAADRPALDRRLAAWFRSHRYAGSTLLHYPKAANRGTITIFNYHSDIRKKHAEGRRNANNDDIASKALPPLELLS